MNRQSEAPGISELALLCLLAEKPMHAYEIEEVITARGMREWTTIGFSSIYYSLKKMLKAGWLEKMQAASEVGGPLKHVFSLSPKGRTVWEKAVLKAITKPDPGDDPFLVGLSVLPLLDKKQVFSALQTYLIEMENIAQKLSKKNAGNDDPVPNHVSAMFDYSLKRISATMDWIREWQTQLGKE